ncbi:uncharacterized protein LOC126737048 [Anthonomus grandis grandis]|uniref:uncharacterized protein LOC126737048 n=1 Tax=Anthonomus grandis grandis TaxID=2921223 RepID=UPI0021661B93|nr:uncharacterized protein LOC126737048 [Anthonomus grandis grandis]
MSDSPDSDATKELGQDKNKQVLFVTLLESYQILFDKKMTPKIKNEKEDALKKLTTGFNKIMGKNLDTKQILKKFKNMKTKVKKIVDLKKSGNKRIVLTEWQKKFYDLWNVGENPVLHRVPGACQAGVSNEIDVSFQNSEDNFLSSKSGSKQVKVMTPKGSKAADKEETLIQLQNTCLQKKIEAAESQISASRAQQSSAEAQERAAIALVNFAKAGGQLVDHLIRRDMLDY